MRDRFHKIRHSHLFLLAVLSVFIFVGIFVFPHDLASAQQAELRCRINFPTRSQLNQPTLAVIRCPFAGDPNDVMYVIDRSGDMQTSERWENSVDFDDDLWIFDAKGDGKANLIIDFYMQGSSLYADLYDDQDGDNKVDYVFEKNETIIKEGKFPTVRFIAQDGWWKKGDIVNYNLGIFIDGTPRVMFNLFELPAADAKIDGNWVYQVEITDSNHDGRPDTDLRQVMLPLPISQGTKTELMVNTDGKEIPPIENFVLWPYLGGLGDFIKPYSGGSAPIQIDWNKSKIDSLAEFVASRSQDANWFIYSLQTFDKSTKQYADFENPFAFYDLAQDKDGYPELIVRSEYYGPHDEAFLQGFYSQPVETIRYSWDQNNEGGFDYKVDLIGRYPITQTVQVGDLTVQTIPYSDYPDWVIGKPWDAGHFVAFEGGRYSSSEGIYDGYSQEWRDYYITGLTENQFLDRLREPRVGVRHEYTPDLLQQPWLYFSPVDHELHLEGAIAGYWNIDEQNSMHYADLDQDGYLDQWLLTHTERTENKENQRISFIETPHEFMQLYNGLVFYGGSDQVKIIRQDIAPSSFRVLPPTDHAEWQKLGDLLAANASSLPGDDLLALSGQFGDPIVEITGAQIEEFTLTNAGYEFILRLAPGYNVIVDELGLGLIGQAAGNYRVYYDGQFHLTPIDQLQAELVADPITTNPSTPQQSDWITIHTSFNNKGARSIEDLPIKVFVSQPSQQQPSLIAMPKITVLGDSQADLNVRWWPVLPGEWEIQLEIEPETAANLGASIQLPPIQTIKVLPAHSPGLFTLNAPFDGVRFTWPVAGLLLGTGLAAAAAIWIFLSQVSTSKTENSEET